MSACSSGAVADFAHQLRLLRQHAVYRDEKQLIQTAKDASEELRTLFEADKQTSCASHGLRVRLSTRS